MAKFTISRLVGKSNKAGLTTWYWQPSATLRKRGWAPTRLGAGIGEDPPQDVVDAARKRNAEADGPAIPAAQLRRIQRPLTVAEAIRRFREAGYPSVKTPGSAVAPATARQYKSKLARLEAWAGAVALSSITPARVAIWRDTLMKPARKGRWAGQVRHHAAHETLRVGRTLFAWLEQKGLAPRGSNPFAAFGLAAPAPRDAIWWPASREAIAAAAKDSPSMALAIDLAFQIGQREADLLKLSIAQYVEIPRYKLDPDVAAALAGADGRVTGIRLRQAKGKRWVEIPVVGATRAAIEREIAAARKAGRTTLLWDEERKATWGAPSPEAGQRYFIRRFAELRADAAAAAAKAGDEALAAELATLQYRDFRRTCVVHHGELGASDINIAAITGHILDEVRKILETYMPRTTGSAARAIALSASRSITSSRAEERKA